MLHFLAYGAMFIDAILLWIHKEVTPMPCVFSVAEAFLSLLVGFAFAEQGRLTTPILVIVASLRFAQGQWFDRAEELAFKYVNAVLLATLAWHWCPLAQSIG